MYDRQKIEGDYMDIVAWLQALLSGAFLVFVFLMNQQLKSELHAVKAEIIAVITKAGEAELAIDQQTLTIVQGTQSQVSDTNKAITTMGHAALGRVLGGAIGG